MANKGASESGFHFIQDYLRCPQFFAWRYPGKLMPIHKEPSLIRGVAIHEALAAYYTHFLDMDWIPRTNLAVDTFRSNMEESYDEYFEQERYAADLEWGEQLLSAYGMAYSKENAEYKCAFAVEQDVSFTFPDTGDQFTGRIDLGLSSYQGMDYIIDHKTTSWNIGNLIRSLSVSGQATGYIFMWNTAHPEQPVRGIIYNILRLFGKSAPEFKRSLVIKAPDDLEKFKLDIRYTLNEIAEKVASPTTRWVQNTEACFMYNRPCPYLELCLGADYQGLMGSRFKRVEEGDVIGDPVFYGEFAG
jgi:hypothetical protein